MTRRTTEAAAALRTRLEHLADKDNPVAVAILEDLDLDAADEIVLLDALEAIAATTRAALTITKATASWIDRNIDAIAQAIAWARTAGHTPELDTILDARLGAAESLTEALGRLERPDGHRKPRDAAWHEMSDLLDTIKLADRPALTEHAIAQLLHLDGLAIDAGLWAPGHIDEIIAHRHGPETVALWRDDALATTTIQDIWKRIYIEAKALRDRDPRHRKTATV